MKYQGLEINTMKTWSGTQGSRFISSCLIALAAVLLTVCAAQAQAEWPQVIASKDGTPISYEVYGAGEPTLIFVHGWSCDSRYWRHQIAPFSQNHKVVLVDLAGHGHSGMTRETYSQKAFGEDVQAVAEATDSHNVILVGHSMGGQVIAEAARLMPQRVKGLIGIDTLENIEYPLSREELDQMLTPFRQDFQAGTRQFVQAMLSPSATGQLREWILADMAAAPPSVALSAMEEYMSLYISGEIATIFDELPLPVMTVNGDMWPIDYDANRRHMFSFDAIVVEGGDHFLMLNRADEFNTALEQAITAIVEQAASK